MAQPAEKRILKIPVAVFESADTKEELEDWIMTNDPEFIAEMERIKDEESGKGTLLKEAAKKWHIES